MSDFVPYAPADQFLWDAWFIEKDGQHHVFYLQTPRSTNPALSVRNQSGVTIGHAVSDDFRHWQELPTALTPDPTAAWDNADLWSGSVAEKDGTYYLYYTGKNNQTGQEHIQKICVTTSDDLLAWQRHPENPILAAAGPHYHHDNHANALGNIGAWRDPFVFKDPHSDIRFMTISARGSGDTDTYNACVALATSEDMLHWKVQPPIFAPGVYDEIEVTRVVYHRGYYYLFFTTHARNYHPAYAKENGAYDGLHCYYSDNLWGGYLPVNGTGMVLDNGSEIFDIRVLHDHDDEFIGIGWLNQDADGNFIGKLSAPLRLRIHTDTITLL